MVNEERKRPGVMLYFDDIRPCMEHLTWEEQGVLFQSILDYAELGVEPDLSGVLGMAWGFIRPKIDRDEETYKTKCLKKKYAAYCRKVKREEMHLPYLSFNEWMEQYEREAPHG